MNSHAVGNFIILRAKLIRCLFTGIGRAHYPEPVLDERGMAAHFHILLSCLLPARLSAVALIGARFPFCQHKDGGRWR